MDGTTPFVPLEITVHLGPPDLNGLNVTVSFMDYIKSVASSVLYPTWPEAAIRANMLAQISLALNRVFTKYYRSQGFDFDITSLKEYDQTFVLGRNIYQNINLLANELFDSYLRRPGSEEPFFAVYCNGTTETCNGLSQWGSVELANKGFIPYDILRTYYGDELEIVRNAPVKSPTRPYPGTPLKYEDSGENVRNIQIQLNRVSDTYVSIPKINPVSSQFDEGTRNAVFQFQGLFHLFQNEIIGKAGWYILSEAYLNAKKLAELRSDYSLFEKKPQQYVFLKPGDSGDDVKLIQYYLNAAAFVYPVVPEVIMNGEFGPETEKSVNSFQYVVGLPLNGVIEDNTWNALYDNFVGMFSVFPPADISTKTAVYPGGELSIGTSGESVLILQTYLSFLSKAYSEIPIPPIDGIYNEETRRSVTAFQQTAGLEPSGTVNQTTWYAIAEAYSDLMTAYTPKYGQFPGYTLREGMTDT